MATVFRKRTLVNPHRRRRNAKRRLTLAQKLAGFGGKRVQAAAKTARRIVKRNSARSHRARTKAIKRKIQMHRSPRRAGHRRRRNVSGIVTAGLPFLNPGRKRRKARKHMAKSHKTHRRRRSNAHHKTHRRRHARRNPRHFARRHSRRSAQVKTVVRYRSRRHNSHRRHHRRSNPSRLTSGISQGLYIAGGLIGPRWLTDFAMKTFGMNNAGLMGYGGNLVATIGLSWGAKKFFGRSAGNLVFWAGLGSIFLRVLQDKTPLGKVAALSGMGDLGMGAILPQEYLQPNQYTGNGAGLRVPPGIRPAAPDPKRGMGAMFPNSAPALYPRG